jgi:hypothetical protein
LGGLLLLSLIYYLQDAGREAGNAVTVNDQKFRINVTSRVA